MTTRLIDPRVAFFDAFGPSYGDMFADADRTAASEVALIGGLLEWLCGHLHPLRILDPTCGGGAHAAGMALRGHDVTATDISEGMLAHAAHAVRQCEAPLRLLRADVRALPFDDAVFDAVMCLGNSVCLFDDHELAQTFREVHRVLVPGALFVVGCRDYDRALAEHRTVDGPTRFRKGDDERVVYQDWSWQDERRYTCTVHIDGTGPGAKTRSFASCPCRAWTEAELSGVLTRAGFRTLHWFDMAGHASAATPDADIESSGVYRDGLDERLVIACAGDQEHTARHLEVTGVAEVVVPTKALPARGVVSSPAMPCANGDFWVCLHQQQTWHVGAPTCVCESCPFTSNDGGRA